MDRRRWRAVGEPIPRCDQKSLDSVSRLRGSSSLCLASTDAAEQRRLSCHPREAQLRLRAEQPSTASLLSSTPSPTVGSARVPEALCGFEGFPWRILMRMKKDLALAVRAEQMRAERLRCATQLSTPSAAYLHRAQASVAFRYRRRSVGLKCSPGAYSCRWKRIWPWPSALSKCG